MIGFKMRVPTYLRWAEPVAFVRERATRYPRRLTVPRQILLCACILAAMYLNWRLRGEGSRGEMTLPVQMVMGIFFSVWVFLFPALLRPTASAELNHYGALWQRGLRVGGVTYRNIRGSRWVGGEEYWVLVLERRDGRAPVELGVPLGTLRHQLTAVLKRLGVRELEPAVQSGAAPDGIDPSLPPFMASAEAFDSERLLSSWRWLVPRSATPLFVTVFGDWVLGASDGSLWALSMLEGTYRRVATNGEEFNRLAASPRWLEENFIAGWQEIAHRSGLVPSIGECIGWKVHPALGGKFDKDNLAVYGMAVYQSLMGQLHQQLQGRGRP